MNRKKEKTPNNITIIDVARLAGVSITTVSRVINKVGTVKEGNRIEVEEAVKKLGFKPDISAQRLAGGRPNIIGLIIPYYEDIFDSYYGRQIIKGVGQTAADEQIDLLLHLVRNTAGTLNNKIIGGLIFADIINNENLLLGCLEQKIPSVVINNSVQDINVSSVAIDNLNGAVSAVDYLVKLGHKRIAAIAGDLITQCAQERLQGYKSALEKHKLVIDRNLIIETNFSRGEARKAAEKLLNIPNPPTAIFVGSDNMAEEAMEVIFEKGLFVPEDISLIGFDDDPVCLEGKVKLTTVKQPLLEMCRVAVEELESLIFNKQKTETPRKLKLPTQLIIRDSCRKIS